MVREALEAGADIIMLDNMTHEQMAEAVALIDGRAKVEASGNVDAGNIRALADLGEAVALIDGRAKVEASGNVDAGNIRALADLGVDFISSGALTHSAPILDLSLKHLRMV